MLTVAIVATDRLTGRTRPVSSVSSSQHMSDPLDWLLEGKEGLR